MYEFQKIIKENKQDKVSLLFIINTFELGGTEKQLLNLIQNLDKEKFNISVFAINPKGRLLKDYLNLNVKIIGLKNVNFFSKILLLRNEIKIFCPIIHCFLPKSYLLSGFISILYPPKAIIMSRRSRNFYQKKYFFLKYIESFFHKRMNLLLVNSNYLKDDLIKENAPQNNIKLIYNGINVKKFFKITNNVEKEKIKNSLNIPLNKIILICVANFYYYKGHIDLINSINLIKENFKNNCHLILIGRDCGSKKNIIDKINYYELSQNISLLGERIDIANILSIADIGLLTSHQEGFSNSVLEMMSSSLPVILTDVGGNSEAIDSSCGILVKSKDIQNLSKAILRLINDSNKCIDMGRAANLRVKEKFNLKYTIKQYEDIYENLK